ncbi:MAG: response regulator [Terracidiphilus sp.]
MSARNPKKSKLLPADPFPDSASPPGEASACPDRILFVDDEADILEGYKRILHGQFDVDTAVGAERGLAAIHLFGPYAIIVSDMRMPGMSGAEFLAQVRQTAPNTVRMLLTGYKDINVAIEAVNEGQIFRYLTKPCEKRDLVYSLLLGLTQYHTNAEREDLVKEAREIKVHAAKLAEVLQARSRR